MNTLHMKFGLTLSAVILCLGMLSCNRDYQCICEYTYTGAGHAPTAQESTTIRGSKSKAEESCAAKSQVFVSDIGDTTYVNCELY